MGVTHHQTLEPIARVHYIARVKFRDPMGIRYMNIPWPPPRHYFVPVFPEESVVEYFDIDSAPVQCTIKQETYHMSRWRWGDKEWIEYIHESDWPLREPKEDDLYDHPRQIIFERIDKPPKVKASTVQEVIRLLRERGIDI